jgi:glycosyltransferase involved in cell wall biosynthesis
MEAYQRLSASSVVHVDQAAGMDVAVRSSATAEDLPTASFAGQQESYLHVRGAEALDMAVRALARLPNAWLWLVGDGSMRTELEQLAVKLNVADRVRFVGWVNDPSNYIAAGDAFLMPSRHEPLGNLLLEAWSLGVPSVSTRSDGPNWYMRDGVDGLMADIDDDAQIANALAFLRDNPEQARTFARNAAARLEDFLSEEAICQDYMRVFRGELPSLDAPT